MTYCECSGERERGEERERETYERWGLTTTGKQPHIRNHEANCETIRGQLAVRVADINVSLSLFLRFSDAVIRSAWFFFVAGGVMCVAVMLNVCGYCARKRKIPMFLSGVAFIVAGKELRVRKRKNLSQE